MLALILDVISGERDRRAATIFPLLLLQFRRSLCVILRKAVIIMEVTTTFVEHIRMDLFQIHRFFLIRFLWSTVSASKCFLHLESSIF